MEGPRLQFSGRSAGAIVDFQLQPRIPSGVVGAGSTASSCPRQSTEPGLRFLPETSAPEPPVSSQAAGALLRTPSPSFRQGSQLNKGCGA